MKVLFETAELVMCCCELVLAAQDAVRVLLTIYIFFSSEGNNSITLFITKKSTTLSPNVSSTFKVDESTGIRAS